MRLKLALLADGANVSREGKLNILGIFDTVFARQFPITHPHMHLVIRLEAEAAEAGSTHAIEVQFLRPDGEVVFRLPGEMVVQRGETGGTVGIDHVLALANLVFEGPGRHLFRVLLDAAEAGTVPLRVEGVAPPGQTH